MFHVKHCAFFLRLRPPSAIILFMKKLLLLSAVLVILAGCATMFGVDTSKLQIGMTQQQVVDVIGHLATINRTTTDTGTNEQWVYQAAMQSEFSKKTVYVYFENGKVKGWQN